MHKVMHKNKIYKLSHGTNAHKKTTNPKMVLKQIIAFYFVAALILQLFLAGLRIPQSKQLPFRRSCYLLTF